MLILLQNNDLCSSYLILNGQIYLCVPKYLKVIVWLNWTSIINLASLTICPALHSIRCMQIQISITGHLLHPPIDCMILPTPYASEKIFRSSKISLPHLF